MVIYWKNIIGIFFRGAGFRTQIKVKINHAVLHVTGSNREETLLNKPKY